MYKVDNAIIMAAGTSSRFAPLSYERPKALIEVKGEILIERQIRQLRDAGIRDIYIVVGYKAEQFAYLQQKFGVHLVENKDYLVRNNHSSIYAVREVLRNTYICSADNYFPKNPFETHVDDSYYAAQYANGPTKEWCMQTDSDGYIVDVQVGGCNAWYMLGHAFWSEEFSRRFLQILTAIYDRPETQGLYWENIFMDNICQLKMRVRQYADDQIFEFDSLDELRMFDKSYIEDTRSKILKDIVRQLNGQESDIINIHAYKGENTTAVGIQFDFRGDLFVYDYGNRAIGRLLE